MYKDRYMFVSYFKKTNNPSPMASWLLEKNVVKIFDLRNLELFWTFDFQGYDSHDFYFFDPQKAIVEIYNGTKLKAEGSSIK